MAKFCQILFRYENKRKISWDNWLMTLYITQLRWRVEKGDLLGLTPSMDNQPCFSNFIELWLSWYKILSEKLKPWASQTYSVQNNWGIRSSTATSSASVDLLVFNFCLLDAEYTVPFTIHIPPQCGFSCHVWPLIRNLPTTLLFWFHPNLVLVQGPRYSVGILWRD